MDESWVAVGANARLAREGKVGQRARQSPRLMMKGEYEQLIGYEFSVCASALQYSSLLERKTCSRARRLQVRRERQASSTDLSDAPAAVSGKYTL